MAKHICQGTKCHTYDTQSRVRGTKGNKVLRTRNARYHTNDPNTGWIANWEYYFCDERCLHDWLKDNMVNIIRFVGIKTKPSETEIDVIKEVKQGWRGEYIDTTIKLLTETTA
jgi:hypothetical protein